MPHLAACHHLRCECAVQDLVRPFVEDRAMKDKKRSIDKFVTLNVQQIAATLEQVRSRLLTVYEVHQGAVQAL